MLDNIISYGRPAGFYINTPQPNLLVRLWPATSRQHYSDTSTACGDYDLPLRVVSDRAMAVHIRSPTTRSLILVSNETTMLSPRLRRCRLAPPDFPCLANLSPGGPSNEWSLPRNLGSPSSTMQAVDARCSLDGMLQIQEAPLNLSLC
jgi:hypothetical protein